MEDKFMTHMPPKPTPYESGYDVFEDPAYQESKSQFGGGENPNVTYEDSPDGKQPEAALDADIASGMVEYAMSNPKMEPFYKQIANDKSSAVSAGLLASQMIIKARDYMMQSNLVSDNKIWAAQGGVLDSVVIMVAEKIDKFSNNMDPEYIGAIREHAIDFLSKYDQASRKVELSQQQGGGGLIKPGMGGGAMEK